MRPIHSLMKSLGQAISNAQGCCLLGNPVALIEPFTEGVDVRHPHAVRIGAVRDEPLLHDRHELVGKLRIVRE